MLRIGSGTSRENIARGVRTVRHVTVTYEGVLDAEAIRAAFEGVRDAGTPERIVPLLSWLASHPNAPEDVLRGLARSPRREVLFGLCHNRHLPQDVWAGLLAHDDQAVRETANHVDARLRAAGLR